VTHIFQEGDLVVSKEAAGKFLPAGSHGTVFCLYETDPPAYEINFTTNNGTTFGAVRDEDELERCLDSNCQPMPSK